MDQKVLDGFARLKRAMNLSSLHDLKDFGIGSRQASVLLCLLKDGPLSLAQMAEHTSSDPAAVTRSLDILVDMGSVEKRDSSRDRRAWEVHLTRKGVKMAHEIREMRNRLFGEVLSDLSQNERSTLAALLEKLAAAFENKNKKGKGEEK